MIAEADPTLEDASGSGLQERSKMYGPRGAGASRSSDDLSNEDRFLVADELGLYAVCDGHGDVPGGEVAAYVAAEAVKYFLEAILRETEPEDESTPTGSPMQSGEAHANVSVVDIDAAIRFSLAAILDATEGRSDLVGMGSTVTLLLLQHGRAFIGHSGDSRAHLVRGDDLVQLTTDHEWTDTADAPAATGREQPPIESFSLPTQAGDTFVLCTDGAERAMSNAELVDSMHDYSPRLLASRIVAAAHRQDPSVDATAVVVRVRNNHEFAWATVVEPRLRDGNARVTAPVLIGRRTQNPYDLDRLISRSMLPGGSDPGRSSRRRLPSA